VGAVFDLNGRTIDIQGSTVQVAADLNGTVKMDSASHLKFDPGDGNKVTFTGTMGDVNGRLSVTTGTVDMSSTVLKSPYSSMYVSGLREGMVTKNQDWTTANPGTNITTGVRVGPLTSRAPLSNWNFGIPNDPSGNAWGSSTGPGSGNPNNVTYIYTGQFYEDDGKVTFGACWDDSVQIKVDGAVIYTDTNWNNVDKVTLTGLSVGWHGFEVRFAQGSGDAGAAASGAWTLTPPAGAAVGFGIDPLGRDVTTQTNFLPADDNGTSIQFRTVSATTGIVTVANGATLRAAGIESMVVVNVDGTLDLGSGSADASQWNITGTLTGGTGTAQEFNLNAGSATLASLTPEDISSRVNIAGGATLTVTAGITGFSSMAVGGTVNVGGNSDSTNILVGGGAKFHATGNMTLTSSGGMVIGPSSGSGSATFEVDAARTLNYGGGIGNNGGGTGGLIKTGNGRLILGGAGTYTGPTLVSAGTLQVDGSLSASSAVTVSSGATLAGGGTIGGTVYLAGGSTLSPGASPGLLTTGNITWDGGTSYLWEICDAAGTAGGDPGWDEVTTGGTLTLNATTTPGNQITIVMNTLEHPSHDPGLASNFSNTSSYVWTIAHASGGIIGFTSVDQFVLDTAGFLNPLGAGTLGIQLSGDSKDLQLVFSSGVVPTETNWKTASVDNKWENASNWDAGVPSSTMPAVFDTRPVSFDPTLSAEGTAKGVTFNSAGWTIGGLGQTLKVGSDGLTSKGTGTNTIQPDVVLLSTQVWTVASDNVVALSGGLTGTGNDLDVTGGGKVSVAGTTSLANLTVSNGTAALGVLNASGAVTVGGTSVGTLTGGAATVNSLHVINGSASLASVAGTGLTPEMTVDSGTTAKITGAVTGMDTITVEGSLQTSGTSSTNVLAINGSGQWDLTSGGVTIGTYSDATVRGYLASGALTSSTVATDGLPTALGYMATGGGAGMVDYTWQGDTNLDGVVDVFNDYPAFLAGYYGGGSTWAEGDFNYDGLVDVFNDYPSFLAGYYGQTGPLSGGDEVGGVEGLGGGEGTIPEPATLALMGLGAIAALARRRRAA
jgi:hypothetical protein